MSTETCKYCHEPVEMAEFIGGLTELIHSGSTMAHSDRPYSHEAKLQAPEAPEHIPFKNPKPSTFPVDTVIGKFAWGQYEELFIRRDGWWEDLFSGCGCCVDHVRVSDAGCAESDLYSVDCRFTETVPSDNYFTDFKVIALPPGSESDIALRPGLHGPWNHKTMRSEDGSAYHECKGYNCNDTSISDDPAKTEAQLHAIGRHPGYTYAMTSGPRKSWDNVEEPPEGEGWERNVDMGRDGWERYDYHEESYWRRKK